MKLLFEELIDHLKSLLSHKSKRLNQKRFLQTICPTPLVYTKETERNRANPNHTKTGKVGTILPSWKGGGWDTHGGEREEGEISVCSLTALKVFIQQGIQ